MTQLVVEWLLMTANTKKMTDNERKMTDNERKMMNVLIR